MLMFLQLWFTLFVIVVVDIVIVVDVAAVKATAVVDVVVTSRNDTHLSVLTRPSVQTVMATSSLLCCSSRRKLLK